jgi:hypothetical protein
MWRIVMVKKTINVEMIDDHDETNDCHHVDLKRQNALFLLKTKEMHQLTQTATDSLVSGTTCIVKNSIEQLKNGVTRRHS